MIKCKHKWTYINEGCRVCEHCAESQHSEIVWKSDVTLKDIHALPANRLCGPDNPSKRHTWQHLPLPSNKRTSKRRKCIVCGLMQRRNTVTTEWKFVSK